ncbi:hypothetical protein AcV5_005593 [Taiwanofungus camphoratus]|nr:hypothetical protein AcV5_005593 [Antrodia cinnamomea]
MSTLKFPLQKTWKSPIEWHVLSRTDGIDNTLQLTINNMKPMYEGNSKTYRAALHCDGNPTVDVVCKIVHGEEAIARLRNEAHMYTTRLQEFQGYIVPIYHGLFEGEIFSQLAACLVTQYSGERLPRPLIAMDWDFKCTVIEALIHLHVAGVKHNDFVQRNVLIDDEGTPFIIDFELAEPHECGQRMTIEVHAQEPHPNDFGCQELHNACCLTEMWTPRVIRYLQCYVPIEYAECPELLASTAPNYISPEDALVMAEYALIKHSERLAQRMACDWKY